MRMWQRCHRKWYLSQFLGLHKKGEYDFNKPFGIGNRIHSALEVYYSPDDSRDPLDYLEQGHLDDIRDAPEYLHDDINKEYELCRIMLEGYMDWLEETGADQALTVLEAERPRAARLEEGKDRMLLAKLDARIRHDELGERISLDHKTVQSLEYLSPEMRLNTQALTQTLIERLLDVEEGREWQPTGTMFNMLKKVKRTVRAKPPFYSREFARHTDSELRNHWRHIIHIADEIEAAENALSQGGDHQFIVEPSPTADCHWSCPFFQLCPMMDNDADRSDLYMEDKFERVDPLQRYAGMIGAEDIVASAR